MRPSYKIFGGRTPGHSLKTCLAMWEGKQHRAPFQQKKMEITGRHQKNTFQLPANFYPILENESVVCWWRQGFFSPPPKALTTAGAVSAPTEGFSKWRRITLGLVWCGTSDPSRVTAFLEKPGDHFPPSCKDVVGNNYLAGTCRN